MELISETRILKAKIDPTYLLACMANAKEITPKAFEEKVGVPFLKFWSKNKKKCLQAWRLYMRLQVRKPTLAEKRRNGDCVCADEEKLEPNSGNKTTGERHRLWWCPVHKNTMIVKVQTPPTTEE